MLERDHPASSVPNRFLGVGRAVSEQSGDTNDAEYLQECGPRRQRPAEKISGKEADHHTIQKQLDQTFPIAGGPLGNTAKKPTGPGFILSITGADFISLNEQWRSYQPSGTGGKLAG